MGEVFSIPLSGYFLLLYFIRHFVSKTTDDMDQYGRHYCSSASADNVAPCVQAVRIKASLFVRCT